MCMPSDIASAFGEKNFSKFFKALQILRISIYDEIQDEMIKKGCCNQSIVGDAVQMY